MLPARQSPTLHTPFASAVFAWVDVFVWLFLVFAIVTTWLVTWQLNRQQHMAGERQIEQQTSAAADVYEAQMIRAVRDIEKTLSTVAYASIKEGVKAALPKLDAQDLLPPKAFFEIDIFDTDGLLIASNGSEVSRETSAQETIPLASDKETLHLLGLKRIGRQREGVLFARSFQTLEPKHRYNIVLTVDPDFLVSAYEQNALGTNGTIGVFDEQGLLLAGRTGQESFWGQKVGQAIVAMAERQATLNSSGELWLCPWDQTVRFVSIKAVRLLAQPIYVMTAASPIEMLSVTRDDQKRRGIVGCIVTAMLLITGVIARLILNRLKRDAEEIRRVEKTYEAASEASSQATFVLDAAPGSLSHGCSFIIRSVNSRACQLLGRNEHELTGRSIQTIIPNKVAEQSMSLLNHVHASGESFMVEGRNNESSLHAEWLSVEIVPVPGGLVVTLEDISTRKNAELALKQNVEELRLINAQLTDAKAQLVHSERLASLGLLSAGIAHEINNPIGFVTSNIGTLGHYANDLLATIEAIPPSDTLNRAKSDIDYEFLKQEIPSLISESKEGLNRVKKIVADLKNFARPESTHVWQKSNLHEGIESTLNIIHNETKHKAQIVKEYGDLPLVDCLPSEINQVIMNLVVNAAQAIDGFGTITIRTSTAGGYAVIDIIDTGSGMSEETKAKIFDPFFTTKPVGKGTGLGLSLSYGIVQKHRGEICVDSTLGVGTRFSVRLPIHQHEVAGEVTHDR